MMKGTPGERWCENLDHRPAVQNKPSLKSVVKFLSSCLENVKLLSEWKGRAVKGWNQRSKSSPLASGGLEGGKP
jgi:hypothetical protein